MKKIIIQQLIYYMTGLILAMIFLIGCGSLWLGGGEQDTEHTETESTEEMGGLFLVLENNTIEESLVLYSYETGLEYRYQYNFSTVFLDKYGNNEPVIRFAPGKVVELEERDEYGYLTTVQMSDEVWEQEKIKRFSIDEERGIFSIGETNYSIQNKVVVFSNQEQVKISDLSENDVLTLVGLGNKILSINVTTGHGTLSLTNTELFDGSLLQLGDKLYAQISEGLSIEVQEGTYTLTVANDGWGSSREITIVRGETTEIDLETMKGPGKKKGMISFRINVDDVKVYIDFELIDHTQATELTYGTHTIEVVASGYDSWMRYLVVNSQEATIIIELEENSKEENSEEESSEAESSEKESSETESSETESSETESSEVESSETESSEVERTEEENSEEKNTEAEEPQEENSEEDGSDETETTETSEVTEEESETTTEATTESVNT